MTKLVAVCLGVLILWSGALAGAPAAEAFELATRVGEGNERSFFIFSTSAGEYVFRHDGMGELSSLNGMRRVIRLSVGAKERIDRVYFLEHQGDLFLLYEVRGTSSYLMRMDQRKRKPRWITAVASTGAPSMQGDTVLIDSVEVSKADGKILRQD